VPPSNAEPVSGHDLALHDSSLREVMTTFASAIDRAFPTLRSHFDVMLSVGFADKRGTR